MVGRAAEVPRKRTSSRLEQPEADVPARVGPEIGQQVLAQVGGVFELLSHIVVAHHERWDGMGYPHRLAKEAIPISARILCVVDSYDAMISDRPYRKPQSAAEARAELQRCSGSQFDPLVVEAFLQVLDEQEEVLSASPLDENAAREEQRVPSLP